MLGVVVDVHEGGAVRVKLDHVTRITNKQSGTNFEKQQGSAASPPKKQGKEETKEEEQQQEGGERDKKETKKKKRRLFAFVGRVMDWFMKRTPKANETSGVEAIDTQALGRIQEAQTLALAVQKEEGRLSLKKARGGGGKSSSSGKSSPPSPRPPPGRGLTFIPSRIEGVLYNSGRNISLAREPYDKSCVARMFAGTQPLLVGAEPWWLDKNKAFGPAFTEASAKALPRAVREEESGDAVLVKWHDQPPMSVSAWNAQLKAWDDLYPNIKHTDGSTPHETEKIRSSRTSSPAVVEACFAKLTKVWWTGVSSSAGRAMCAAFRPDSVCSPPSLSLSRPMTLTLTLTPLLSLPSPPCLPLSLPLFPPLSLSPQQCGAIWCAYPALSGTRTARRTTPSPFLTWTTYFPTLEEGDRWLQTSSAVKARQTGTSRRTISCSHCCRGRCYAG